MAGRSTDKWLGGALLLGVCTALALGFWQHSRNQEDALVRQKLDNLLQSGEVLPPVVVAPLPEAENNPPEENSLWDQWFRDPFSRLPETLIEMGGGMKIDETPHAYILSIPLADPKEAEGVDVQVTPHRIQVASKRSVGEHGSASFFQSFTTSSEVLPDAITRQIQPEALVVTIPKKQTDTGLSTQQTPEPQQQEKLLSPKPQPGTLSPEALQELLEKESHSI